MILVYKGRRNPAKQWFWQTGASGELELVESNVITRVMVYLDNYLCLDTDNPGDPVAIQLTDDAQAVLIRFGLAPGIQENKTYTAKITIFTGQDPHPKGLAWGEPFPVHVMPWPICPSE